MLPHLLNLIFEHNEKAFLSYTPEDQSEYFEVDPSGRTLLMNAILEQQLQIVDFLLAFDMLLENKDSKKGRTPLHYCALTNDVRTAKKLIDKGVKIDALDNFGNTPLWRAVFESKGRKYEIIEFLVKTGANPNVKNDSGISPIDFATKVGNENLMKILSTHTGVGQ